MAEGTKTPLPPLILGIVTPRMLASRRYPSALWECSGAELRADGLSRGEILPAVEAFAEERDRRGFQGPVVLTLRLRRDGGSWDDARAGDREPLWLEMAARANRGAELCDFLDVEIETAESMVPETWEALWGGSLEVLLSHHAFGPEAPSAWEGRLEAMRRFNPDAVKFAVAIPDRDMAEALLRFARRVAAEFPLSCVIGMGEPGRATRVASPLIGCPLAYAFLDEEPVAPGQLSVETLRACLERAGRPELDAPERQWMDWIERALRETEHGG